MSASSLLYPRKPKPLRMIPGSGHEDIGAARVTSWDAASFTMQAGLLYVAAFGVEDLNGAAASEFDDYTVVDDLGNRWVLVRESFVDEPTNQNQVLFLGYCHAKKGGTCTITLSTTGPSFTYPKVNLGAFNDPGELYALSGRKDAGITNELQEPGRTHAHLNAYVAFAATSSYTSQGSDEPVLTDKSTRFLPVQLSSGSNNSLWYRPLRPGETTFFSGDYGTSGQHANCCVVLGVTRRRSVPAAVPSGTTNVAISEGVELGDTQTAIVTKLVTITEGAELGDTQISAATKPANISEGVELGETVGAQIAVFASILEGVELGDVQTETLNVVTSILEGVEVGDAGSEVRVAQSDVSEGVELGDTSSELRTVAAAILEGVELGDTGAALRFLAAAISEGVELGETSVADKTAGAAKLGAVTEGVELGDTQSSATTFVASVVEGIEVGDGETSTVLFVVEVTEGVEVGDAGASGRIEQVSITEGVELGEANEGKKGTFVDVVEGVEVGDAQTTIMTIGAAVLEGVDVGDDSASTGVKGADVNEGVIVSDDQSETRILPADVTEGIEVGDTPFGKKVYTYQAGIVEGVNLGDVPAAVYLIAVDNQLPTELDLELVPAIFDLLAEFGKDVGYDSITQGVYDPVADTFTGASASTHSVKVTPPEASRPWSEDSAAWRGDYRTYMAAKDLPFTPKVGDEMTIDGMVVRLTAANPIASGTQIALWEIELKGDNTFIPSTTTTDFDQEMIDVITELIEDYGRIVTVVNTTSDPYDPVGDDFPNQSSNADAVKSTPPSPVEEKYVDGSAVQKGDVLIYIGSDISFAPDRGMNVSLSSTDIRKIIKASPVWAREQIVLWELQLRR